MGDRGKGFLWEYSDVTLHTLNFSKSITFAMDEIEGLSFLNVQSGTDLTLNTFCILSRESEGYSLIILTAID